MTTEPFRDRIGNRLDHPELVPPEYQHLIADDQQRVRRILEFPVSGRVLDVGCSDGAITQRIAARWRAQTFGLDANPGPMVWYQHDVRHPLVGHPLYDAVYACEIFEHLTDADAQLALTNILAVLKPGGDLIVTVPNRFPHDRYAVSCRTRWAWPDHRSAWGAVKLDQFLTPHFEAVTSVPLYDDERPDESIWLIMRAKGKR